MEQRLSSGGEMAHVQSQQVHPELHGEDDAAGDGAPQLPATGQV